MEKMEDVKPQVIKFLEFKGSFSERIDQYTKLIESRIQNPKYNELNNSGLKPYDQVNYISTGSSEAPMTFCFSYVNYGKEDSNQALKYFKASIATTYPNCAWAEIPFKCDFDALIPVRTQAYAKMRRSIRGNIVFIDPDVIAYKRVNPFEVDFDVGLTDSFKTWPMMPFNGGIQFMKDTPGAQRWIDLVMEIACNTCEGIPGWWTDQLAMRLAYEMLKNEIKIKIFPHELFNFTPEGVQATDAYFVHLKGDRKQYMRQYLATVLETDHFELA